MDLDQTRVQDDLRGIIDGDVIFGDLFTQMYATDASIYQLRPFGVVRPRSAGDVATLVRYAAEHSLSVHARGAGSSLAGESLGKGIVVDFSRYMRRWRMLDDHRIRVQPGVNLASLNRDLKQRGRMFAPDPATRSVTTLGSVIAQDASGSHFPRYGSARDWLRGVQIINGTGEQLELGDASVPATESVRRLEESVRRIARRFSNFLPSNDAPPEDVRLAIGRGAYGFWRATRGDRPDLPQLLAGSEGSFGLITEATLETAPVPKHRGVLLLFFRRIEAAAHGALLAVEQGAVASDLMDRRLLEIARETDHRYDQLIPREAEAMVLSELQGDTLPELRDRLQTMASVICEKHNLAFAVRITTQHSERDFYWRLCRRVIPRLYRLKGSSRPLPFIEDMAVPPKRMPEFLIEVQEVLKRHQITATVFAHAGHGQLHMRPFLDLASPSDRRRIVPLAEEFFATLQRFGGRVCAEQGAGLSRSSLLRKQLGPLWPAMLELKRAFDPANTLNPGKFISTSLPKADSDLRELLRRVEFTDESSTKQPDTNNRNGAPDQPGSPNSRSSGPVSATGNGANDGSISSATTSESNEVDASHQRLTRNDPPQRGRKRKQRASTATTEKPTLPLVQRWPADATPERVARECNGCGRCRTTAPNERMCPVFRAIPSEEASPRAKANLMRGVLTGDLPTERLHSDEMKEIADLCFHCHQCRLECPASVDIPKLASELKSQYVATNGLPLKELAFSRLDLVEAIAAKFPRIANGVTNSNGFRWLLERTMGLSRARRIPRFATRSFMRYAARQRLTRMQPPMEGRGAKVVFFVDQFVNYHDPALGRAFLSVMARNNVEVYVPPKQSPCGMTLIAAGDLNRAAKRAEHNVRILADAIRAGYQVVATEPTAVLCLTHEYLNLLDSEDARLVAGNTFEACRYLWDMHCRNELALDFRPVPARLAYHQPCHVRAIDHEAPGPQLMRLLPRLTVDELDKGCTGMAGTWGLLKKNYRTSLRIGWPLLSTLKRSNLRTAATECSACRMQLEHGSGIPTIHPIKLLAYAYGELPELGASLGARN